jgi:pyruvate,orthophosphate dikinase
LEVGQAVARAEAQAAPSLDRLREELALVQELGESNPMLGTRGVRLGIGHPDIYEVQVRAILRAAKSARDAGGSRPDVEIMVPLVAYERELTLMRTLIDRVAAKKGSPPEPTSASGR